jgi:hypothetical protein
MRLPILSAAWLLWSILPTVVIAQTVLQGKVTARRDTRVQVEYSASGGAAPAVGDAVDFRMMLRGLAAFAGSGRVDELHDGRVWVQVAAGAPRLGAEASIHATGESRPRAADGGWEAGERNEGLQPSSAAGWSRGTRADEERPCDRPRPELREQLERVSAAIDRQDLGYLRSSLQQVSLECPSDWELVHQLRDAAIEVARSEARDKESAMRSAESGARRYREASAVRWRAAAEVLDRALREMNSDGRASNKEEKP